MREHLVPAADLLAMLGIGNLFDGVSYLITKFCGLAEKGAVIRAQRDRA